MAETTFLSAVTPEDSLLERGKLASLVLLTIHSVSTVTLNG